MGVEQGGGLWYQMLSTWVGPSFWGDMRVISGSAKGRRLKAPPGRLVRPTSDLVKESLFNLLRVDWESSRILDLFAGSGALGIEALSRGAREALFVERDPVAIRLLVENLEACRVADMARVVRANVLRFLSGNRAKETFDVVFADPPYDLGLGEASLKAVEKGGWMRPQGIMALEHSKREQVPARCGRLVKLDDRLYGDTRLSIYCFAK